MLYKKLWLIKLTNNVVERFDPFRCVKLFAHLLPSADQVHFELRSTWTIIRFNIMRSLMKELSRKSSMFADPAATNLPCQREPQFGANEGECQLFPLRTN